MLGTCSPVSKQQDLVARFIPLKKVISPKDAALFLETFKSAETLTRLLV